MSNEAKKADAAKASGNQCFKDKDFAGAIKFFSEAIDLEPENEVHYSNRSAAHLKNGGLDAALVDADKCVVLKPDWGKGYSRKGACLLLMTEVEKAVACYEAGLLVDPENKVLLDGLATAQKALTGGTKTKKKKKKGKKGKVVAGSEETGEEGEKKESYVIGIDLGTTYSCVGVFINDKVRILENKNGQRTIPSYVCFDPETGERSCGHAAKNQSTRFPKNVVYDVKRIIGQRYKDNGVADDISKMMYEVVKDDEGKPVVQVQIKGETVQFAPEEISAMVLTYCKKLAESELGVPITRAVVTVPAYFNDSQRQATKLAGQIAGLDVLRIINEPTAAALSYGLDNQVADGKPLNIVIFDLGGGTFDVSILTIEGGLFTVKATGGDTRLGGEDFDNNLMRFLLSEAEKQGIPDPSEIPAAMQRLKKAAETCKRELSSAQSSEIHLDALVGKSNFHIKVTRAKFEAINKGPFLICIDTVTRVLKDAKLKTGDINEVVLVGGSTRIPKLQEMLSAVFGGKALCKSLNPDEAVAYGAAIQGAVLSGKRNTKTDNLLLMDVTPLSLGIEITGNVMSVVIPRNTPIPCIKTQTYTTDHDYQTEDTVPVYEGERLRADENNLLGEFTITGIERAKKGEPSIAVSFAIDSDGILNVTAIDQKTKAKANITIANRSRATTDQIDHMVAEAAKYKSADEERLRKVEAKNELEEVIYNCLDIAKDMKDAKLAAILQDASEKEQAWLDANYEDAKTTDIALRRRTLARRLEGKNR